MFETRMREQECLFGVHANHKEKKNSDFWNIWILFASQRKKKPKRNFVTTNNLSLMEDF